MLLLRKGGDWSHTFNVLARWCHKQTLLPSHGCSNNAHAVNWVHNNLWCVKWKIGMRLVGVLALWCSWRIYKSVEGRCRRIQMKMPNLLKMLRARISTSVSQVVFKHKVWGKSRIPTMCSKRTCKMAWELRWRPPKVRAWDSFWQCAFFVLFLTSNFQLGGVGRSWT